MSQILVFFYAPFPYKTIKFVIQEKQYEAIQIIENSTLIKVILNV